MTRIRPDLGVLLHRLAAVVIEREQPLLQAHGLQMWDYVVLSGLEHGAAPTQSDLAVAVGRDKTRLIPILDRLAADGLVDRRADPDDRRNRIVSLTPAGRTLLTDCRRAIRAMESELLTALPGPDRKALVRALVDLHEHTRSVID